MSYNKVKKTKKDDDGTGTVPYVKKFESRNSLLTDLMQNKNIRTVYHMFIAILIGLGIQTAAQDYLYYGKLNLGFKYVFEGFSKPHVLLFVWICMFLGDATITYFGFKCWAIVSITFKPKSLPLRLWHILCVLTLIVYNFILYYFVFYTLKWHDVSPIASMIILSELTRITLKSYGFIRSNAPKILQYKPHCDAQNFDFQFSRYLYYFLAPTMVYRDEYPRSKENIRWKFVLERFSEIVGAVFLLSFIFERAFINDFKDYGLKSYSWKDILVIMFSNSGYAILALLTVFYSVLHAWCNLFAEILGFADRLFYKDWWASSTFAEYFQTWNLLINEYLDTYYYNEAYKIAPKHKKVVKLLVFFLAGIFHDLIVSFSFGFYLPTLFILFYAAAVAQFYIKTNSFLLGNVFLWCCFAFGSSLIICSYTIEYFARLNCPIENLSVSSYFIPRMFNCGNSWIS